MTMSGNIIFAAIAASLIAVAMAAPLHDGGSAKIVRRQTSVTSDDSSLASGLHVLYTVSVSVCI